MTTKIGKALVLGSGIGGIRAALDLAEYGYGVTLVDRSAHIGGILSQLDYGTLNPAEAFLQAFQDSILREKE